MKLIKEYNLPKRRSAVCSGHRTSDSILSGRITIRNSRNGTRNGIGGSSTSGHSRETKDHGEEIVQMRKSLATSDTLDRYKRYNRLLVIFVFLIFIFVVVDDRRLLRMMYFWSSNGHFCAGRDRFFRFRLRNLCG